MEMHGSGVSDCLIHLVKTIIGTGPVQDPHLEQAKENRIINMSPIDHSKPFSSPDHIGPKLIIEV